MIREREEFGSNYCMNGPPHALLGSPAAPRHRGPTASHPYPLSFGYDTCAETYNGGHVLQPWPWLCYAIGELTVVCGCAELARALVCTHHGAIPVLSSVPTPLQPLQPQEAMRSGARESLIYVPCIVADGSRPDYLATVDVDAGSPTYGQVRQPGPAS
jgi:hypothetical protein